MIQEAVVVMTILGCGDQVQSCDLVMAPERTWATHAECNQAIPATLKMVEGASYPVLTANCEMKANPKAPLPANVAENNASESEATNEKTTFEKIRTEVEATNFDLLGKVKASLSDIADSPKVLAAKIRDVFSGN